MAISANGMCQMLPIWNACSLLALLKTMTISQCGIDIAEEEIDLDYAMLSEYAAEHFWNKIKQPA